MGWARLLVERLNASCRVLLIMLLTFPTALSADDPATPTCDTALPNNTDQSVFGPVGSETMAACVISWVQNGRLVSVNWEQSDEDFAAPFLHNAGHDQAVLYAERPPMLIDIDQDGWLDLAVFTLIGMVNGDYDVFRYSEEERGFVPYGLMNGHSFARDRSGYLVARARGNAATAYFEFFDLSRTGLASAFTLQVTADDEDILNGAPQCQLFIGGEVDKDARDTTALPAFLRDETDLIQHYCNIYRSTVRVERSTDLAELADSPQLVPDGTVFHCLLSGTGKAVTVSISGNTFTYRYGAAGLAPELELVRERQDLEIVPRQRFETEEGSAIDVGHISFFNGDDAYSVHYSIDPILQADNANAVKTRGLIVGKSGEQAPVFDRTCDPETAFDVIADAF